VPSQVEIGRYLDWFADVVAQTYRVDRDEMWESICLGDLNEVDHEGVQSQATSHLWRFRPDAIVIRRDLTTSDWRIHLLNASSSAISLKDVGIMNGLVSVVKAELSICISPKGISNEVRILQADRDIRDRLLMGPSPHRIALIEWSSEELVAVRDAVIPDETADLLIGQRFQ